jgi:hypothetical protein
MQEKKYNLQEKNINIYIKELVAGEITATKLRKCKRKNTNYKRKNTTYKRKI